MKKWIVILGLACLLAGCKTGETTGETGGERMQFSSLLFSGAEMYEWFNHLADVFPSNRMQAPPRHFQFPAGPEFALPATYTFQGQRLSTADLLTETDTAALLVIQDGRIRYENYWLTGGPDVHWMSMSVGKSFVSALVGIAIEEGRIGSIEEPVTQYVPELLGSAYDNVRIKDILQMSSGARWNEDYSDPDSDIARSARVFAEGASLDAFTASLVREREPGTYNYYNSTDTQALGMLLVRATGMSLAAYAEQKLWQPLQMEYDGYWVTDNLGMEMAAGGLQVTARDYAKLGQLYLQEGQWQGHQIVPARWVRDSVTPDGAHVTAAADDEYPISYGYQWWVPLGNEGEFMALGIYNQMIYVNPTRDLVMVKLSASNDYASTNGEESWRELETIEFLREIGRQISGG